MSSKEVLVEQGTVVALSESLLSRRAPPEAGVALGKRLGGREQRGGKWRDACCALARAPPTPEGGAACGAAGGRGAGLALDGEWLAEHAAQVARMLPGGVHVLGLYLFCKDDAYKASAAAVGRAARAAVAGLRPAPPRALVVHLSADTGRVSARYVDLAAAGGALEPIECRAGAVLRHLRPLRARYEPRCAAAADPGEDLLAAARRAIQGEQKALEGALAVVGGKLARGTQLELTMDEFLGSGGSAGGGGLSSAAAKKRGKGKGKGSKGGGGGGRKVADSDGSTAASAAEPLDVELLVPAAAAAAAAAATIGGGVSICGGSIAALSFAHGRETLQQALEDLRADMVGSLRARAELLCEADDDGGDDAGDRAEEEENDPPATVVPETPRRLALPRRCAVPWHAPLLAIDHAAEGEGEEDVLERCQDMLGFADEGEARQVEWLERPADTASAVAARQPEAKGDGLDDDDGGGGASAAATGGKSASWMPLLGAAAAAFTAAFAALDMNDDGAFNLSPLIS